MVKVEIQSVQYEKSDTVEMQGTCADTKHYLHNGYYVKEEKNGYWILNKPSRVLAEILINNKKSYDRMWFLSQFGEDDLIYLLFIFPVDTYSRKMWQLESQFRLQISGFVI